MDVRIRPNARGWLLSCEQWLPRPRDEVFAFFADAGNLEALTPGRLRLEILTPGPIVMRVGLRLDYRLKVRGYPVRGQSEITAWEPPERFADEQRRGPYRWWVHEHSLGERDGGTEVRDEVSYGVPGGALVHRLLVASDLRAIFAHRSRTLARRLGEPA